ncbi:MAG: cupin-like domain-containing protein [Acidobacteriota bacterium]
MICTQTIDTVERVAALTKAAFETYISAGRPVIITDVVNKWPAYHCWTIDYLKSIIGDTIVPVEHYPEGDYYNLNALSVKNREPMRFGDYLDLLEPNSTRKDKYYLAEVSIKRYLSALKSDYEVPQLLAEWHTIQKAFIGYNSISAGHYHPSEQAFLCQVRGRKRVILYPPKQTPYLYPFPCYSDNFNFSQINPAQPNYQKFASFHDAQAVECMLEPGEILFIPIHWWHFVYGLDFSVSITFFWWANWQQWVFPTPGLRTFPGLAYRLLQVFYYSKIKPIYTKFSNSRMEKAKTSRVT